MPLSLKTVIGAHASETSACLVFEGRGERVRKLYRSCVRSECCKMCSSTAFLSNLGCGPLHPCIRLEECLLLSDWATLSPAVCGCDGCTKHHGPCGGWVGSALVNRRRRWRGVFKFIPISGPLLRRSLPFWRNRATVRHPRGEKIKRVRGRREEEEMLRAAKTPSLPGAGQSRTTDRNTAGKAAVVVIAAAAAVCFGGAAWAFSSVAPEPYMVSWKGCGTSASGRGRSRCVGERLRFQPWCFARSAGHGQNRWRNIVRSML